MSQQKAKPREMTALDVKFAAHEFKELEGGKIEKIYHEGKRLRIRIYANGEEKEFCFAPGRIFISSYRRKAQKEPSPFCMLLRKHLCGKRITSITQKGFERIVELKTNEHILIFELFSHGNVVLCKNDYTILMPMSREVWSKREILPGKPYKYPPSLLDPFSLSREEFCSAISGEKKIASFLATSLSLSGIYAEELCARAGIDKAKPCKELGEREKEMLYEELHKMINGFSPCVFYENEKPVNFAPFPMKTLAHLNARNFETFNEALDEFYTFWESIEMEETAKKEDRKKEEKLKRILEQQKSVLEKLKELEESTRKKGDVIFSNLRLVENIISGLKQARELGMSWEEIKEKLRRSTTKEAKCIKQINEKEGKVKLVVDGIEIEVNLLLSAIENAQVYYEKAKKYRKKCEALKEKIKEVEKELQEKIQQEEKRIELILPRKKEKKAWYEKFRWSITSEGFLVIAGKDATQNEVIYKKYLEKSDVVLHADIRGAPLTVVKANGREITENAIREAAVIAASYSSAWKLRLGNIDVYWVLPEQVSKTPPAGEFLPKGAFMIYGKKNYIHNVEIKICIGIMVRDNIAKIYAGSFQGACTHCRTFVTVYPGEMQKTEAAKKIRELLFQKLGAEEKALAEKIPLDYFISALPGKCGKIEQETS